MLLVEIHETYLKELHQYHIYCKNSSVLSIVRCIRDKVLIENGTHIYLEVNAAWAKSTNLLLVEMAVTIKLK